MPISRLYPAANIVAKFGGEKEFCRITGYPDYRVRRWQRPEGKNGTGGYIPSKQHPKIMKYAEDAGIDLSPEDFFVLEPEKKPA